MKVAYVRVYLDDDVPEFMQGIIRCGHVVSEDKDGNELRVHEDLIDNTDYHSAQDLIDDVARRIGVSSNLVGIES